ncbi:MAG: PCYCGC motif-containing (lipo)protein [Anaerolineae bacterium]
MKNGIGLALLLVLFTAVVLVGCTGQESLPYALAPESKLPAFLSDAQPRTREAYQFASANHHELEKYPCTCGCVYLNHASNADCYIKLILPSGLMSFDQHANGCGVCIDITQDVMRLTREGHSPPEIRAYIDAEYSKYGPPTNTSLPVA